MMATSATEEEFLQVLDEMNRICGAEEGAAPSSSVSALGFEEVGEIEEGEEDDDDKGRSKHDILIHETYRNLPSRNAHCNYLLLKKTLHP